MLLNQELNSKLSYCASDLLDCGIINCQVLGNSSSWVVFWVTLCDGFAFIKISRIKGLPLLFDLHIKLFRAHHWTYKYYIIIWIRSYRTSNKRGLIHLTWLDKNNLKILYNQLYSIMTLISNSKFGKNKFFIKFGSVVSLIAMGM